MNTTVATPRARRGHRAFLILSWLAPLATMAVLIGAVLLVMNDLPPGSGPQGPTTAHVLAPWAAAALLLMLLLTVFVALSWVAMGVAKLVRGLAAGGRSETSRGLGMAALGILGLAFAYSVLRFALAMLFGIF